MDNEEEGIVKLASIDCLGGRQRPSFMIEFIKLVFLFPVVTALTQVPQDFALWLLPKAFAEEPELLSIDVCKRTFQIIHEESNIGPFTRDCWKEKLKYHELCVDRQIAAVEIESINGSGLRFGIKQPIKISGNCANVISYVVQDHGGSHNPCLSAARLTALVVLQSSSCIE